MKTTMGFLLTVCITTLLLTFSVMAQPMQTPDFFTDKNRYISFIPPQGWHLAKTFGDDPRTKLMFAPADADANKGVTLTIIAYQVDAPRSLASLRSFLKDRLDALAQRADAVSSGITEVTVAETTCVQSQVAMRGARALIILGYPQDSLCLDVVYHAPAPLFDTYLPDVRESLETMISLKGAVQENTQLKQAQQRIWLLKQVAYAMDTEQYEQASEALKELIRQQPDDPMLFYRLGEVQKMMGHPESAIYYFSGATDLDPDFWEAHFQCGMVAMHQENYEAARDYFLDAVEANPDAVEAKVNLAVAYRQLEQPEKAVELYEQLLTLNPANPVYLFNLGRTYSSMGDYINAKASYEQCLAQDADNTAAMVNLAYVEFAAGNKEKAQQLGQRALALDPTLDEAQTLLKKLSTPEEQ